MADLGWFVFSAGGAIVCLTAAAAWTLVSHGSAASRRVLIATVLVYWTTSSAVVPDAARRLLAFGYTPVTRADVPAGHTAVVLLGSGSYRFRDWSDNQFSVVDPIGASRLLEAARVFHLLNADYIISSGGLSVVRDRNRPSGLTMAEALQGLGVPKDRLLVETESTTTRHEAVIIKDMLAAHPVDQVVLVTSQFHMRRAVGTFKAMGIEVVPAIAREPLWTDPWWEMVIPSDKALDKTGMAAHELAGIVAYGVRGWYRF